LDRETGRLPPLIEEAATMDWMAVGERFGLPGVILLGLCVWLWRVSVFVAPLVRDMVTAHITLVTTVSNEVKSQTRISRRQTTILKNHGDLLKSIESNFDRKEKAA
jgi:hypothetical protein